MNTSLPKRKILSHAIPSWAREDAVFFISVNCKNRGVNLLCHCSTAETIRETVEHRNERGDWWVYLLMVMPDHLHMLVSFPRDAVMKSVISRWKEYLAKQTDIRWQRDFFDHRLRSGESFMEKSEYIRDNPVRARLVQDCEEWPYVWTWSGRA